MLTSVQIERRRPTSSATTNATAIPNQTSGFVPSAARTVNAAMPVIEPAMSIAYALSGRMLLSSGPSGRASVASSETTRKTTSGRIRKFWSAALLSASPKKISSGESTWTLSCWR